MTVPALSRRSLGLATLGLFAAACGTSSTNAALAPPPPAGAHWGYDGADGPDHWADLDHDYSLCGTGGVQSPIDLSAAAHGAGTDIVIDYAEPLPTAKITHNGHTLQIAAPAGNANRIVVGGKVYDLQQFHFHTPSEHTVDGATTAMELHLVHRNTQGRLAVLAVLLTESDQHSPYRQILFGGPAEAGKTNAVPGPIDLNTFLPTDFGQYQYTGSLTTPPCSEGVAWTVLRTRMPVGADEAAYFRALFPHNARPVRPVNGRPVVPTEH